MTAIIKSGFTRNGKKRRPREHTRNTSGVVVVGEGVGKGGHYDDTCH